MVVRSAHDGSLSTSPAYAYLHQQGPGGKSRVVLGVIDGVELVAADSLDGTLGILGSDTRLTLLQSRHKDEAPKEAVERFVSAVERFVMDECELTPGSLTGSTPTEVFDAYRAWATPRGEVVMSQNKFSRELTARLGVKSRTAAGRRMYAGLALKGAGPANELHLC
ncbi:hypothetical protein C1S82_12995 [Mycolicibacterium cosmeticum]|uniref:Uncharacterized protein n=2 Tax=Mycolicibacterium cosmeticum TaxID=258533 RepID=W9AIZ4_MYCCO|nr:hypothetical protein C1S82_12995 [Mycolicibacterium cosmeticum]CDO05443.1 hypothetical protein BN977_00212 [Mycolicibacterium cosmeticum]